MRHLTKAAAVLVAAAVVTTVAIGAFGPAGPAASTTAEVAVVAPDRLADRIARAQERLRTVPGDWRTWAALSVAYLEQSRIGADPSYYPKAEGAARRSLEVRPNDNPDALVASGALANARHDFTAARAHALAAIKLNAFDSEAYAVLADAETQLGHAGAATAAIQRQLDLRPGLSAYARASYDLELRGRTADASALMRQALDAAVDPHDIAFCRTHLGDLAYTAGDLAGAEREYQAGLAAAPSTVALRRGLARVAAARGDTASALTGYAEVTRRAPTPGYLIEYADLLRTAGRTGDADTQLSLATAAHQLFTANGGIDGLTGAELAIATGRTADALGVARAEWNRRKHPDVASVLAKALRLNGRAAEPLTTEWGTR